MDPLTRRSLLLLLTLVLSPKACTVGGSVKVGLGLPHEGHSVPTKHGQPGDDSAASHLSSVKVAKLTTGARSISTGPRLAASPGGDHGFHFQFQSRMLHLHNTARRAAEPPAANMQRLKWNADLARLAEIWSRRCAVGYGLPLGSGPLPHGGQLLQNVWTGPAGSSGTAEGAVSSWLDERLHFNHGTGACYRASGCGRYLTMVFASTNEVGCGQSTCADDVIVVCYYGSSDSAIPPSIRSPYIAGQPCSQCGNEDWCDDGLCRPTGARQPPDRGTASETCPCAEVDDDALSRGIDLDESAFAVGSTVISVRVRRHAANDSETDVYLDNCGYLDIPLWIFVGLLAFVVFVGLFIGIIGMVICICRDLCKACAKKCRRCCRNKGGYKRTRGWCSCCGKLNNVHPDHEEQDRGSPHGEMVQLITDSGQDEASGGEGAAGGSGQQETTYQLGNGEASVNREPGSMSQQQTRLIIEPRRDEDNGGRDDTDGSPGQQGRSSALGSEASVNREQSQPAVRMVDIGVNTEGVYVDRSVCTDTLVRSTSEAGTNTEASGPPEALSSSSSARSSARSSPHPSPHPSPQASPCPSPSPPSPPASPAPSQTASSAGRRRSSQSRPDADQTPTPGICMEEGCTACPLHTRDQREVEKEKLAKRKKLIRARRDPNLKPGTYLF